MSRNYRLNLLVLCGRNKQRSRTAEYIFKNDSRFAIRSAGLSPQSDRKVQEADLRWADKVIVMENSQQKKLRTLFPQLALPEVHVLHIPDDYAFMDETLVGLLKARIPAVAGF
ncbi:MAG: protein-tyrosine-phosphatase [Mucilaginibacter polytrichastri]|nr:protein-tyrosine-phosphatase [Mucilaginibacter polytrichastri]